MNPPRFTGSSTSKDPNFFLEELKKVFNVMHVVGDEGIELVVYQLEVVDRTWFDQWKDCIDDNAPRPSWGRFE